MYVIMTVVITSVITCLTYGCQQDPACHTPCKLYYHSNQPRQHSEVTLTLHLTQSRDSSLERNFSFGCLCKTSGRDKCNETIRHNNTSIMNSVCGGQTYVIAHVTYNNNHMEKPSVIKLKCPPHIRIKRRAETSKQVSVLGWLEVGILAGVLLLVPVLLLCACCRREPKEVILERLSSREVAVINEFERVTHHRQVSPLNSVQSRDMVRASGGSLQDLPSPVVRGWTEGRPQDEFTFDSLSTPPARASSLHDKRRARSHPPQPRPASETIMVDNDLYGQ